MKVFEAIQQLSKLHPNDTICIDWWTVDDVKETARNNEIDCNSFDFYDFENILESLECEIPEESNLAIRNEILYLLKTFKEELS